MTLISTREAVSPSNFRRRDRREVASSVGGRETDRARLTLKAPLAVTSSVGNSVKPSETAGGRGVFFPLR